MRAFRSGLLQREKVLQLATPIIMSLMAFHIRSRRREKSAWRERFGYRSAFPQAIVIVMVPRGNRTARSADYFHQKACDHLNQYKYKYC